MLTAIIETDAGRAYLKAMGNPEGPHALACELVCTRLALWFGLPVLDNAILPLTDADTIQLDDSHHVQSGPAFVTRAVDTVDYSGTDRQLELIENPHDIARLVVFDTWVLNADRHPRIPIANPAPHPAARDRAPNRNNVLLTTEGAPPDRLRLLAMDFTHAISVGRELTAQILRIELTQDEGVYGLFPEFRPYVTRPVVRQAAERLREATPESIRQVVDMIPAPWEVGTEVRSSLVEFLHRRAVWLADRVETLLTPLCFPQGELEFGEGT